MIKAREVPNYKIIEEKIRDRIKASVEEDFKKKVDSLPHKLTRYTERWVWYVFALLIVITLLSGWFLIKNLESDPNGSDALVYISGSGLVIGLLASAILFGIIYYKKRLIKEKILSCIKQDEILESVLNEIPEVKYEGKTSGNNLFKYRCKGIPSDARTMDRSKIINLKIFGKYDAKIQTGEMRWRRKMNKEYIYIYQRTGYIELNANSIGSKLTFSLFDHNKWAKEDKLENQEFVNLMHLKGNDPIALRMAFTPLAMESMVNFKNDRHLYNWKLVKTPSKMVVSFEPDKYFDFEISFRRINLKNIDSMIDELAQDAANEAIKTYKALTPILLPALV